MIDQNTLSICRLIRQAFARNKKAMSLNEAQCQQLAIAFAFLRRIDCIIGQYADECQAFYTENREKLSDKQLNKRLKEISGGNPFYNVSGYTFERLLKSELSVEVALNSFLQGYCDDILDFLKGMDFSENIAVLMRQSKYLVELFEFYSELDFSATAFSKRRFVDLITILASGGSKADGLFPTPIGLSKLMCECLFEKGKLEHQPNNGIDIYDPACGTGSLLAYAGEKAKAIYGNYTSIDLWGNEISPYSSAIAKALILLTGSDSSYVFEINTLEEDLFAEDPEDIEFRFIISDLPLGLPWTPFKESVMIESMGEYGRYKHGLPSTKDSQFLFIEDIVSKMEELFGRAAFITSSSVLQGGSVTSGEARIRRWLFETNLVETIIALPSGILSPLTKTPVYLWILSCHEFDSDENEKVRLIDANRLVSPDDSFTLNDDFIDAVVREYKSPVETSATRIINKDDLGFYELTIVEGKKKETVRISIDTDIHEYIEKERKPFAKGEISIDYKSVDKGYSVDFNKFFKLKEPETASLKEASENILSVVDAISSIKEDVELLSKSSSDAPIMGTWREIPLRAAIEQVRPESRFHSQNMQGIKELSKAYLKGDVSDLELFAITNNGIHTSPKNVFILNIGKNTGMVFKGAIGVVFKSLLAFRSTKESIIDPDYLYYLLKGHEKYFSQIAKSSAQKSLAAKAVLDLKCLVPPIEEQKQIVHFLDGIVDKLDNVIHSVKGSNTIFMEYEQTLIENAVRGRIR